jgi:hypothetical protein
MNYKLISIKKDEKGALMIAEVEEHKGWTQAQAMAWAAMLDLFQNKSIHMGWVKDLTPKSTQEYYCARTIEEDESDIVTIAVVPSDMKIDYEDQIEVLLKL